LLSEGKEKADALSFLGLLLELGSDTHKNQPGVIKLSQTPTIHEHPVTLIHHAASCGDAAPPGSLAALEQCFSKGAAFVEIDVIPLADGSFALLHDQDLAAQTTGIGNTSQMGRSQVGNLFYQMNGSISSEKVGFLEGAIELLQAYPKVQRLQLDFKPFTPLTAPLLMSLMDMLTPVIARVQVSSVADWAIRALARTSNDLALGFDPLLYLDIVDNEPRPDNIPPFRMGAYGLLDDHPLSAFEWGSLEDYFAARAEALFTQVPQGCEWFIRAEVLQMALDAGFDWIAFLQQRGSTVDGWTIDVSQPAQVELAHTLVGHGIDKLTTDTPDLLAAHLPVMTIV